MSVINLLEEWFKSNCDSDWEHGFGVKIETLDNPGWLVKIDLIDTVIQDKTFEKINMDNSENDWITCIVEGNMFKGYGDPDKLEKIIEIFLNWSAT